MDTSLKKHGLRVTPQRLALLQVLQEFGSEHPSFTQVFRAMQARFPHISQSTIHNNLKMFLQMRLLSSFTFRGETRYELNLEPHVNFVKADGTILDVQNAEIIQQVKRLLVMLRDEENIDITHLTILAE